MKPREVRAMPHEDRMSTLDGLRQELMHERGVSAMGGAPPNPGRMRALRRDIARFETVLNEERRAAAATPVKAASKTRAKGGRSTKAAAKAPQHGQSKRKSERRT